MVIGYLHWWSDSLHGTLQKIFNSVKLFPNNWRVKMKMKRFWNLERNWRDFHVVVNEGGSERILHDIVQDRSSLSGTPEHFSVDRWRSPHRGFLGHEWEFHATVECLVSSGLSVRASPRGGRRDCELTGQEFKEHVKLAARCSCLFNESIVPHILLKLIRTSRPMGKRRKGRPKQIWSYDIKGEPKRQ